VVYAADFNGRVYAFELQALATIRSDRLGQGG